MRIFLLFLLATEKMTAQMEEIKPTSKVVPSPPRTDNNKTTKSAPKDAPMRSDAYNRPAMWPKALNAAEITIPTKKNGIAKRSMNRGK
jgi:hypothetical protein